MIAALTAVMITVAATGGPLTEPKAEEYPEPKVVMTYSMDKIVLHEQYQIVQLRGGDVYQRAVLRQFKFYHQGKLIETLNDNAGKLRPLRVNGEWWLLITVGGEVRVARTSCYEYLSTIKSDKDVEAQKEQRQEA